MIKNRFDDVGDHHLPLEGEHKRLRRHKQLDVNVEARTHEHSMESWACVILFTM